MNETITININDTEIRNIRDAVDDLRRALESMNSMLSESSGAWESFESSASLAVGVLGLLVTQGLNLNNIPDNIKHIATSLGGLAAKKGGIGLLGKALLGLPIIGVSVLLGGLATALFSSRDAAGEAEDAFEDLREELEANREAHERNISAIRRRNSLLQTSISMTRDLSGATNRSAGETGALQILMNLLNGETGDFRISVNRLTGALDENSIQALDNMASYYNISTAIETSEENMRRFIELHHDHEVASTAVANLDDAYQSARQALEEAGDEKDRLAEITRYIIGEYDELGEECRSLIDAHVEAIGVYVAARGAYEELAQEVGEYRFAMEKASGEMVYLEDQITESMIIMAQAVEDGTWRQVVSWDQLTGAQQGSIEDLVGLYDFLRAGSVNALTRMGEEATVPIGEMIRNLDHNYDAANAWGENLVDIYERTGEYATEGFMAFVEEMAMNNPAQLAVLANASDDELRRLAAAYERNCDQIRGVMSTVIGDEFDDVIDLFDRFGPRAQTSLRETVAAADFANPGGMMSREVARGILEASGEIDNAMNTLASNLETSADNILAGFTGRINSSAPETEATASKFANTFINSFQKEIEERSPSRVFERSGENIIAGLVRGIRENQDRSTNTLERVATAMQRVYNRSERDYQNIGRDIINGLNQGILNREGTVMNTVSRIANNITREMQRALQINSPSRVMRESIGRFIPEGVAAGIDKYAGAAIDSVYKLGNDLINVNIPSVESMIGMGPSMRYAGAGGNSYDNRTINNSHSNAGLFEGANIHWHNKEDIRQTMKEIAWTVYTEEGVL